MTEMNKLSELINKIEISGINESVLYRDLLSQPEVMATFEMHKDEIDLGKLADYIGNVNEYVTSLRKCHDCTGLPACKQPIRGHYPELTPQTGRLNLNYTACGYFKSQQHLTNLAIFHMPKSMINANFENMHSDANREELFRLGMDFAFNYTTKEYKKGLFLYGSMGSGKTYAICAIANELAKRGIGCGVVYFPELIASIKSSFNTDNNTSDLTIQKLKDIPVLMLDDIGSESVTSWMRDEVLGRILNHRMMHELPTFFTSNFNFDELKTHYTQTTRNEYEPVKAARILERIKALATHVEVTGRNYRNE